MSYYTETGKPEPYFKNNRWYIPIITETDTVEIVGAAADFVNYTTTVLEIEGYTIDKTDILNAAVPFSITPSVLAEEAERNWLYIEMQQAITITGETPRAYSLRKSIESRLSAIEADEISDDATSSALLTLIAGLTARVVSLEQQ